MKPTFALDLSRDTIALLHRTPKGWLSIGEVAFDAPDLDDAVAFLRKTALGLSPMDMACKIVLPASQILYTEIHAPGPSREDKRRQIAAALEGRTPYDVQDLVFDWSGKGATVKVAVVARETLEEAEAFAVTHRLNPVSFVAIPEEGTFVGEAWFGPTAAAEPLLAAGTTIDRDRDPVVLLQRDVAPAMASAPGAADGQAADALPDPQPELEPEGPEPGTARATPDQEEDTLPGLEEALNADLPDQPEAASPVTGAAPLTPDLDEPVPEAEATAAPAGLTFADVMAEVAATEPAPAAKAEEAPAGTPAPAGSDEVEEAPFTHVADTPASGETDDPSALASSKPSVLDNTLDDDVPPAPPAAAMVAFASRRAASAGGIPRPVDPNAGGARPAAPPARPVGATPATRTAPPKGIAGLVTAPSIPGTRTKPKLKPGASVAAPADAPTTVRSPARPGGTFGNASPQRGRTGVMFLVLVVLLLISLALIAAWSSFYLSRNDSESAASEATLPAVEDEMLADLQDPEGLTDPLPEAEGTVAPEGGVAALATEPLDEIEPPAMNLAEEEATDLPAGSLAEVEVPAEPTAAEGAGTAEVAAAEPLDPAPGMAVTTDLSAATAPVEDQDEIFLAAMDAPPPATDALALPVPSATPDALPDPPMPPPAFGTVYQFEANGLLKPTPEGIMSPDGVFLIAGPPPRLPPTRSEAATAAALAAAAAAQPPVTAAPEAVAGAPADPAAATTAPGGSLVAAAGAVEGGTPEAAPTPSPADPALAGFRPRPRPEGLVVPSADDDASVVQETTSTFAGLRPLPRPASVTAAASASRPAAPSATADLGAQGASLAAQAEAQAAAAAALEAENPSVIAFSKRPASRPRDLSRAVEAAVAAAVREPDPVPEEVAAAAPPADLKPEELDELDEPETASAAPKIPTKASVAKQATFANAINLSKINLIGTYGTDSRRTALIRQSNGRYKKVKVGDKIDGGTVKAITETEVRYQKGGKLLTLKMPKA